MAIKTVEYRKGDTVRFRKVSLDVGDLDKIDLPEAFRGLVGTVLQVRPFNVPGFQATIVVEVEGVNGLICTEQQHIRLLTRGPKVEA